MDYTFNISANGRFYLNKKGRYLSFYFNIKNKNMRYTSKIMETANRTDVVLRTVKRNYEVGK